MLTLKPWFSSAAIILTFVAFVPYIVSIVRGQTKPHVFSWVIWGLTTAVVFFAQLQGGAGVGAWPVGVSGAITLGIATLAYRQRADVSVNRLDWFFLLTALTALPLWYVTSDPLWAVVILTFVDTMGFGPTLRKVYQAPDSEPWLFLVIYVVRCVLVLLALEHYSVTTALFPATVGMGCIVMLTVMFVRHWQLSRENDLVTGGVNGR